MTEPALIEKPKKSVWDVIDSLLPSAAAVYGRIREQKTGTNPFGTSGVSQKPPSSEDDLRYPDAYSPYNPETKKKNTLLYVVGGVALIGLGIGTYYFIKKNKTV